MAERPHRVSQLRTVPDKIVPVTLAQLQALAKTTKPVKESSGLVIKNHNENVSKVDITAEKVTEFLDCYKLEHDDPTVRPNGAVMWRVIGCPFNSDHAECAVFLSDGSLGFDCFHNSNGCCDKHWKELRLHLEEVSGKKFYFPTNTDIKTATGVATSKLNVKAASAIKPEALEWLWKGKIPFGKLTLFVGNPGVGKGLATMDIAARASTARPFPDCPNPHPVMDSLIFSSEDAASDTLVPRLMAAKADLEHVFIVETTQTAEGEKQFSLDVDLPALRETLTANPNIKLVVIDPLLNHLGDANGNREQEVRSILTPLGMLATEFKVADFVGEPPEQEDRCGHHRPCRWSDGYCWLCQMCLVLHRIEGRRGNSVDAPAQGQRRQDGLWAGLRICGRRRHD